MSLGATRVSHATCDSLDFVIFDRFLNAAREVVACLKVGRGTGSVGDTCHRKSETVAAFLSGVALLLCVSDACLTFRRGG